MLQETSFFANFLVRARIDFDQIGKGISRGARKFVQTPPLFVRTQKKKIGAFDSIQSKTTYFVALLCRLG